MADVPRANDALTRIAAAIEARKGADPGASYVASLFAKGDDAILKKIGEEATETVMAAKDGDKIALVGEVADLWFHTLVCPTFLHFLPRCVHCTAQAAPRQRSKPAMARFNAVTSCPQGGETCLAARGKPRALRWSCWAQ